MRLAKGSRFHSARVVVSAKCVSALVGGDAFHAAFTKHFVDVQSSWQLAMNL